MNSYLIALFYVLGAYAFGITLVTIIGKFRNRKIISRDKEPKLPKEFWDNHNHLQLTGKDLENYRKKLYISAGQWDSKSLSQSLAIPIPPIIPKIPELDLTNSWIKIGPIPLNKNLTLTQLKWIVKNNFRNFKGENYDQMDVLKAISRIESNKAKNRKQLLESPTKPLNPSKTNGKGSNLSSKAKPRDLDTPSKKKPNKSEHDLSSKKENKL